MTDALFLFKMKSVFTFMFMVTVPYLLFVITRRDSTSKKCLSNEFHLKGMNSCRVLLTCRDFKDVKIGKLVGVGAVKAVYHAKWRGFDVALSVLNNPDYKNDFMIGANNMRKFQHNPNFIQMVGFCSEENMFLSEYHRNGNALQFFQALKNFPDIKNGLLFRINLCLTFSRILVGLHHPQSTDGTSLPPHVMCDSNDLKKLLSQLLLTENLTLILNDLDAIPSVREGGIKCGHRELKGNFVAPEQLWKLPGNFNDEQMPGYNEKVDIWKAPSVCNYFLGGMLLGDRIKMLLSNVHNRCKNVVPKQRPTAKELVKLYLTIKREIESGKISV